MGSGFMKNLMISLAIAIVLVVVVNVVGELTVRPRDELPPPPAQPVAGPQQQPAPVAKAAEPAPVEEQAAPAGKSPTNLLTAYTPEAGKKAFRKCKACHTSKKGEKHRVGPNLWDIVGRDKGGAEGYKYSDAMMRKGGSWTYKDIDRFLANPRTFIIGTKMSIKGYKDPAVRASLIGFLRTLSDSPKPLPE